MLEGRGAGGPPTASAVLGDLVVAARNRVAGRRRARPDDRRAPSRVVAPGDVRSAFYLAIKVADRPGVLAAVATVFGDHGVSIRLDGAGRARRRRAPRVRHAPRPPSPTLRRDRRRARRTSTRSTRSARCSTWSRAPSRDALRRRHRRATASSSASLPGIEPVVTLCEGGTPLLLAPRLSARVGADVYLKVEGANPTGSFKDRGMTVAITKALAAGSTHGHLRVDGQHLGVGRRVRGARGARLRRRHPRGQGRRSASSPRRSCTARASSRSGGASTTRSRSSGTSPTEREVTVVNSINPDRIAGQASARLRARRRARARARRPLPARRQRRQHHRVLAGLLRATATPGASDAVPQPARRTRRPAPRRSSSATSSSGPRRWRRRSASATPRAGRAPSTRSPGPVARSARSATTRSSRRGGCSRPRSRCSASRRARRASRGSSATAHRAGRSSSACSRATG